MTFEISKGLLMNSPARDIRREVFVEEQGFTLEFDDIDAQALHTVLFWEGYPAATGRTFPKQGETGTFLAGRVAVRKLYRGKRLGAAVMLKLEELARENGAQKMELSAQTRARGFYEALGYAAHGEEYRDEYCPHITMEKAL